ncbi:MAG: hypothetical protein M1821_007821 [Bathelium mastoideum]|nr:MAG: hypothetical protein M1821_007821 [Bathelium mastoideum]KAI9688582.1 MAG: hypothetical protein M1822_001531 [Bathelium mastoideum]
MASRFCCSEDDRPGSPLPNVRLSPTRTQHVDASTPYAPLGSGPHFPGIRTTDLDELRVIFENATADESELKSSGLCNLQGLYDSPRKAPLPPQRSVGQQLRRKFPRKGTNSGITVFTIAKRKLQTTKESIQSLPLTLQKRIMLETLLSNNCTGGKVYDRDAEELRTVQRSSGRINSQFTGPYQGSLTTHKNRSVMRSFEWMSPLFDGHHTLSSAGLRVSEATRSQDMLLTAPPRSSISVPNFLDASIRYRQDCQRSPAMSSKSESAIDYRETAAPAKTHHNLCMPKRFLDHFRLDHLSEQKRSCAGCLEGNVFVSQSRAKDTYNGYQQHTCDRVRLDQSLNEAFDKRDLPKELETDLSRMTDAQKTVVERESSSQLDGTHKTMRYESLYPDVTDLPIIRCSSRDSSGTSLHLQNMQISHRLRSGSNISDGPSFLHRRANKTLELSHSAPASPYATGAKANSSYHHRASNSGFRSANIPTSSGITNRDEVSSIYSSQQENSVASPHFSALCFPCSPSIEIRTPTAISPSFATAQSYTATPSQADADQHVDYNNDEGKAGLLMHVTSNGIDSHVAKQIESPQVSSSSLSRTSKFIEDVDALGDKSSQSHVSPILPMGKKRSTFNIIRLPRSSLKQFRCRISGYDGPADETSDDPAQAQRTSGPLLPNRDEAAEMWERALKAHADEKATMWLKPDDHRGDLLSKRERRHSNNRSRTSSNLPTSPQALAFCTPAIDTLGIDPFDTSIQPGSSPNPKAYSSITAATGQRKPALGDLSYPEMQDSERHSLEFSAWSRYPSHTRPLRCGSAGPEDNVFPRDFVRVPFDKANREQNEAAQNMQVQTSPDIKRFKKRFSFGSRSGKSGNSIRGIKKRLPRSHSLTFGRAVIRHYASFFKPQSHEFFHYGHGHRSSVSTGEALENPELEILRPVLPTSSIDPAASANDRGEHALELSSFHAKGRARAVDGAHEGTSTWRSFSTNGLPRNLPAGDVAETSLLACVEEKRSSRSNELDINHPPEPIDFIHSKCKWGPGQKQERGLPSGRSDPISDSKTGKRVASAAIAWSKVYEDCVDQSVMRNHLQNSNDKTADESKGRVDEQTRDSKAKIFDESKSKCPCEIETVDFDPKLNVMDGRSDRNSPASSYTKSAAKIMASTSRQGHLLLLSSTHLGLDVQNGAAASTRRNCPDLTSSPRTPALGTSEVSFLEALKRNEGIEKERVLKKAEEFIV